ncbi:putative patatin-like phospholipase [Lyophyllum shimeji]|uniref:Patatin-like phospholipase n=1 Tax=Lyophyllum shimeji TaxID=47721 RepID=A0A9P3UQU1_LYOSH|nr:putative patatin-like phospholipase [Lyophyllum shimeji]
MTLGTLVDTPEAAPRRRNAPASDCEPNHEAHTESGNTLAVDVAGPQDRSVTAHASLGVNETTTALANTVTSGSIITNSSNPSSSTSVQSLSAGGHGFFHHAHGVTVQGGTFNNIGRDLIVNNYGPVTKSDSKKATYKRCPPPTRYFKGRQKILAEMAAYFFNGSENQHVCVLHGLGGVGKTQIAYQFVERCAKEHRFSEIFLVDASNVDTITTDLSNISLGKNIGESADEALRWLADQHHEWLVLFNNADDVKLDLFEFFPPCSHGNILITTRNPELSIHAPDARFKITDLEPEEATDLLLSMVAPNKVVTGSEHDQAAAITKELFYHPLAVVQAGAYIAKHRNLSSYLELYRNNQLRLWKAQPVQRHDNYQWTVYTTWQISVDCLKPVASMFLRICSYMHYDGISEDIFKAAAAAERPHSECQALHAAVAFLQNFMAPDGDWNTLEFEEMMGDVKSYSLLHFDEANKVLSVHPLVHEWMRLIYEDDLSTPLCAQYLVGLSVSWRSGLSDYLLRRAVLPHIDAVQQYSADIPTDLLSGFALVYHESGRFLGAEKLQVTLVEARKRMLGKDHPDTLESIGDLALTYLSQGRFKEAEKLGVEVVEARKQVLGNDRSDMLTSIANLALTYQSQGRFEEAERLGVEVVEASKQVLGKDHPDTLISIANLALTYQSQGRFEEAEKLEVEVVEASKQVLGKDHPDTLISIGNLAGTYRSQGRFKEAERLGVEVVEAMKQVLGKDHPDTLESIANLAVTYLSQGRFEEAKKLGVEVVEARKQVLGKDHPDTLNSIANLAATYLSQGRFKEAERLGVEVVEARKQMLGKDHPNTLTSIGNLASTYQSQGCYKEAERLGVEVVEARKQVLGKDHPDTLNSIANLALTYRSQGRFKEAERLGVEVVEARKEVLGKDHPNTLTSIANLAWTYHCQGRFKEAERLGVEVVEARKQVLGKDHPETLTSIGNLAVTYWSQGRFKEAERLGVEVVEARKQVLGKDHPDTLNSIANLASTYQSQGRFEEAERLEVEVVEARKQVLGKDHPNTLQSIANLASTYQSQGRFKEAERLGVEVVEARKQVLAKDHPDTLNSIANLASMYQSQGRFKEAERLEVEVVEAMKQVLGKDHPSTLTGIANLALTYRSQGRFEEAERLGVEVVEARKRLLGKDHPDTLKSIANLAAMYRSQGRFKEAEKLEVEVVEASKQALGEDHVAIHATPQTLATTSDTQRQSTPRTADRLSRLSMSIKARMSQSLTFTKILRRD